MRSPNWMVSTTAKCSHAKVGSIPHRFVSSMFLDQGRIPRARMRRQCPLSCDLAVRGEPVTIFGDGEQSRDFIYVKDAVSGLVFAAEKGEVTGVFNCGYGHQTTINELIRRILAWVDSRSPVVYLPERPGDVRHSCASTKKFCDSGWRPVSSLDDGLRETLEEISTTRPRGFSLNMVCLRESG